MLDTFHGGKTSSIKIAAKARNRRKQAHLSRTSPPPSSRPRSQGQSPKSAAHAGLEICILAGGLSKRMGRDKSRVRLDGRTMLAIVQKTAKATGFKVRIIRHDLVPRCGPLGGIYSGLKTAKSEAVIFMACDMPFITATIIHHLARFSASHPNSAAFLGTPQGFSFPVVVPRQAIAIVVMQIENKRFSVQSLAKELDATALPCPPEWIATLQNINTPGELAAAERQKHFRL